MNLSKLICDREFFNEMNQEYLKKRGAHAPLPNVELMLRSSSSDDWERRIRASAPKGLCTDRRCDASALVRMLRIPAER